MDRFNLDYVEMMLPRLGRLESALDVGAFDVNGSPKEIILARGIEYTGCDLSKGPGVDVTLDITAPFAEVDVALCRRRFDLVLCLNTLEHLFEPVKALDNMASLTKAGGYLLVIAPVVWEFHDWPSDFYRLNPDFFIEYAKRRGLSVVEGSLKLSARDTRRFSEDLRKMPEEVPRPGPFSKALYAMVWGITAPGLKESWPRTSVNVTYRKPSGDA